MINILQKKIKSSSYFYLLISIFMLTGCSNSVDARINYSDENISKLYMIEGRLIKRTRVIFKINGETIVDENNIFNIDSSFDLFIREYKTESVSFHCSKSFVGFADKYFACEIMVNDKKIANAVFE